MLIFYIKFINFSSKISIFIFLLTNILCDVVIYEILLDLLEFSGVLSQSINIRINIKTTHPTFNVKQVGLFVLSLT
jgi:hypothetical protein